MGSPQRRQIIILGMHRSGTSAITGALRAAGAWLGTDQELTESNEENPLGFFEHREIRKVCDGLLAGSGADWWKVSRFDPAAVDASVLEMHGTRFAAVMEELAAHGTHAIKEPRLCVLLPALERHLHDPVVVFVARNPLESARSLRKRNGFSTLAGLALWEAYNLAALTNSAHLPRVFVNYDEVIAEPGRALDALAAGLAAAGAGGLDMKRGLAMIDRTLRHYDAGRDAADYVLPAQEKLWIALTQGRIETAPRHLSPLSLQILEEFEADEDSHLAKTLQFKARIADLAASAEKLAQRLEKRETDVKLLNGKVRARDADVKEQRIKIARISADLGARQDELLRMKRSISWRITAPLRYAVAEARHARRSLRWAWWTATFRRGQVRQEQRWLKTEAFLAASSLFDRKWYLETYPDVASLKGDALVHYVRWGAYEGRDPNACFDSDWYLSQHPEVAAEGGNPLAHYISTGAALGFDPHPNFDGASYLERHPDVVQQSMNPLQHYLVHGRQEGRGGVARPLPAALLQTSYGRRLQELLAGGFPPLMEETLAEDEERLAQLPKALAAHGHAPLVSVVMPTYNRAAIIRDSIATVIEQDYPAWELLVCDDASTDDTEAVVAGIGDPRIRYLKLAKAGGAAARNAGLKESRGAIIAYLDSDNFWHPCFLSAMVLALLDHPGRSAAYSSFIDYQVDSAGRTKIRSFERSSFDHERLLKKNYIDLNTFVHRRELYECFGGFDERLTRRQDYDLILKSTWMRDPVHVPCLLALYQRNEGLAQVTTTQRDDDSCIPIIDQAIARYFSDGLPRAGNRRIRRVTVLSWDACRNHHSKAFALAEALSTQYEVQLISFLFFEGGVFPPLKDVKPSFETLYLPGGAFPEFFDSMARALAAVRGDVVYAVKPRLPSLGLGLLANQQLGVPVILEINDLETVVSSPRGSDRHREMPFEATDLRDPELLNPYSDVWSQIMDPLAKELPVLVTHNRGLDGHYGRRCLYMRNIKDERVYDPALYDRKAVRAGLGFAPDDRIILFGGLVRKHKGIYELVELVRRLGDPRYKLLFVGSRPTPDQEQLLKAHADVIRLLPPQDGAAMARINLAADLVVLWLDPAVPASHYQMPYKATDALAMRTPIIANDISDLGELGRQGYLRVVPFGDWDGMVVAVRELFANPEATEAMRDAGRRLYSRQFSYPAARTGFDLAVHRALAAGPGVLQVAQRFADRFAELYAVCRSGRHDEDAPPRTAARGAGH